MEANQKIYIIGIGDDGLEGLTVAARTLIAQADVLLGSRHTLVAAPESRVQQVEVGGDLDAAVQFIALNPGKRIVVLMAGDPLFFGAARFSLRPAGPGAVRGRAACEQHAVGFRPRQRELG